MYIIFSYVSNNFLYAQGNPAPTVEVIIDTLHVFGVDRLSTDEILRYFGDYSPSYVLWLDDSSANLVCEHARTHACTHARTQALARVHTHTHIHTHTHTPSSVVLPIDATATP